MEGGAIVGPTLHFLIFNVVPPTMEFTCIQWGCSKMFYCKIKPVEPVCEKGQEGLKLPYLFVYQFIMGPILPVILAKHAPEVQLILLSPYVWI